MAYGLDGDIYVGDPATGVARAIVIRPAVEVNPIFSPDGSRIAFIRLTPPFRGRPGRLHDVREVSVVVVTADGSDERAAFSEECDECTEYDHAWTPDSAWILLGETLYDAAGSGTKQVLPLNAPVGIHSWDSNSQVAPMFRPQGGDEILNGNRGDEMQVIDRDLGTLRPIGAELLAPYEPYSLAWITWSPDGTQILFNIGRQKALGGGIFDRSSFGLFVMDFNERELRRLAQDDSAGKWSPDSSRIAFERKLVDPDQGVLVLYDLESKTERVLESTLAPGKHDAVFHHWFWEGWMWAPDGRSLLVLKDYGGRDLGSWTSTQTHWSSCHGPPTQNPAGRESPLTTR